MLSHSEFECQKLVGGLRILADCLEHSASLSSEKEIHDLNQIVDMFLPVVEAYLPEILRRSKLDLKKFQQ